MLIAEQVAKNGMAGGSAFCDELTRLIIELDITRVIETGTYHGTGTTSAVLKGLKAVYKPYHFISIEVNPEHVKIAKKNLGQIEGFEILQGLSVAKEDIPTELDFRAYPDYIVVDHQEKDRQALYYKEVNYAGQDNLLQEALRMQDYKPELVILDSAGHMGTIEFEYLMRRVSNPFILALDDTNHVKHYQTVEKIQRLPGFTEVFTTDQKFGSRIYAVQIN